MTQLATFDPESIATELAAKLSARSRHVSIFIGAGASCAAGLPDLKGLENAVRVALKPEFKDVFESSLKNRTLEQAISYLRRLSSILEKDQSLGGFTADTASKLQAAIINAIIPALDHRKANLLAFKFLANWASGEYYHLPVEIFTINYDLLVETGLEGAAVPYFDGFVGNLRASFRPELIELIEPTIEGALPATFVRLWKLHGSVNWEEIEEAGIKHVVRLGSPTSPEAAAAIYPSDEKYDQSRRVPFVVLLDRFRRALKVPESITLVSGYSFGDQHLNELLYDAARAHPRSETVVFIYGDIPSELAKFAESIRSFTVLGSKEAIIGGRRLPWDRVDALAGIWEDKKFLLADFKELTRFLATSSRMHDINK